MVDSSEIREIDISSQQDERLGTPQHTDISTGSLTETHRPSTSKDDIHVQEEFVSLLSPVEEGRGSLKGSHLTKQDKAEAFLLRQSLGVRNSIKWLACNSAIALFGGIVLLFLSVKQVPMPWWFSEALKKINEYFVDELASLVGSMATAQITYVLQLTMKQYAHIVLAGDFTLQDLRWMQGVNEVLLTTEFPDRRGAPPKGKGGWLGSLSRFCLKKRLAWYVVYLGLTAHTMSMVALMKPGMIRVQHVLINGTIPCGVKSDRVTLGLDHELGKSLSPSEIIVLTRLSFAVGQQYGSYPGQVLSNTTSSVAGRLYAKDNYAYGAVGGVNEALQNIPAARFDAECTQHYSQATAIWQKALPGLSPPLFSSNFDAWTEVSAIPDGHLRVTSHQNLTFEVSLDENVMYAIVGPTGQGAFVTLSINGDSSPTPMACAWKTAPKVAHVRIVNRTAGVIGEDDTDLYPALVGRSVLGTLGGMASVVFSGASIDPNSYQYSRWFQGNDTASYTRDSLKTERVVEALLAEGGKAAMTRYNVHVGESAGGTILPTHMLCESGNKTISEHWRFGNAHHLGWIGIIWTISIGAGGMFMVYWRMWNGRVQMLGRSPLGATGGLALGIGEPVEDWQVLTVQNGKVINADRDSDVAL